MGHTKYSGSDEANTYGSMIKLRMEKVIETSQLFNENSYGFIKHRSAIDCVNHLLSVINEKKNEGLQVMGTFVDFDAFNNVKLPNGKFPCCNLNRLGIPRQYVNWILNSYKNREITIETIGGDISKTTSDGIPQGDVFSPVVFLLYTTSIFTAKTQDTELFQFADDICILAWGSNPIETCEKLQEAISSLMKVIIELGMQVSLGKSKAIWFDAQFHLYDPIIRISGTAIEFNSSVKFLGIYLDEKLNFQKHIIQLLKSVEIRLNIIKMFAVSKWGGHPTTLLTILKSIVRSKIDYGTQ